MAPALACREVGTAQEGTVPSLSIPHRPSTGRALICGGFPSTLHGLLDEISQLLSADELKRRIRLREGQGVIGKNTACNEDAAHRLATRHQAQQFSKWFLLDPLTAIVLAL